MDYFWLAVGIAALGYFIGDGLKNFKNPPLKSHMDFFHEEDDHELIKEKDVHYFLGISKEDAKALTEDHPDIPHIVLNGKVYYPKGKLRKWLADLGE
ncbi:DNA-binding protein [Virgibacillus xinjiangensis]|uniref:DNA-binding protein n=1 Tax=Virgibacillus xinjiangensis TaxID=393090 RepID=A0ABV7CVY6_9BACI